MENEAMTLISVIILIISILISVGITVAMLIINYKLYEKFGEKGWVSLVPIYNMWVLLERVGLPGWLILIPGANNIVVLIAYYKLAAVFNKPPGFGIGLVLAPIIFIPILVIDKNIKAAN